jgi:hypothetical protein
MTSSDHAVPGRGPAGSLATRHAEMVYPRVDGANRQSTRLDYVPLIDTVKHSFGPRFPAGHWMMT